MQYTGIFLYIEEKENVWIYFKDVLPFMVYSIGMTNRFPRY